MIIAIHQPQYLPWLGYFDKMDQADAFCYLDNVQYKKNEWQNRNRLKTAQGWQWLTVPVRYRFPQKITEVTINTNVHWQHKHLQALSTNYHKAKYFNDYFPIFESALRQDFETIADLNIHMITLLREILGINNKPVVRSSELSLSENPTGRLIDICEYFSADTYLSGQDGSKYMEIEQFIEKGIQVVVQEYHHPVYAQCFGEFQSHMSIVDLIFNCGPESLSIIRKGRLSSGIG
jgi:hypothetical protein